MSNNSVIISAKRTPIGSFQGSLSSLSAPKLGSKVFKNILENQKFKNILIDEVIMGNVLSAGLGQAPARQAALYAGLPNKVHCLTINKMCGSGLKAIMLADQSIRCHDSKVILAGGMESMSNAPHIINNFRNGQKLGHSKIVDTLIYDGLWDVYNNLHMGNFAEMLSLKRNYSRDQQDKYAKNSYEKAQRAQLNKNFDNELVSIKFDDKIIDQDEEPLRVNFDKFSKLKPAFEKSGVITAANASTLNDGAAAVLMMSEKESKMLDIKPKVKILAHATYAHEPEWFTTAPIEVIKLVLNKADLSIDEIGLWEINEAFSAVPMVAIEDLKINSEKVNIYGGAVALGHPIGASGARILTTLINGMFNKNEKYGLAALCIGGGEAVAMILEKI